MDIEYKGGNCIIIDAKKTTLVFDPKIEAIGFKNQGEKGKVQILTQAGFGQDIEGMIAIDGPGEYEVENASIKGVAALAHLDPIGSSKKATMYRVEIGDISVAVLGHVHPDLSELQLEELGLIDVLVIPVGGNGYTLDSTGACKLVKAIEPKIVIPTHYADPKATYPVLQADLDLFVKELGAIKETVSKLKLKAGSLPELMTIFEITRTA